MSTSLDGNDLYTTFGFAVEDVGGIHSLPPLKTPTSHDWSEEDGVQAFDDADNIKLKPRDITLKGNIVAGDITDLEEKINNLNSLLLLPGERSLVTPHSSIPILVRFINGFTFAVRDGKTHLSETKAGLIIKLRQSIPSRVTKVSTPEIVQVVNTVTITCATFGTLIYYTTDGSTPDDGDNLYSAPFDNSAMNTIKAIAYYDTLTSGVATHIP